jgi:hypothetical protein
MAGGEDAPTSPGRDGGVECGCQAILGVDDPSISKAVHKVLTRAEECTRMVRSISLGLDMQDLGKPQRKALICAVSDYEHISRLPNAHSDGAKLGALLLKFGWKVTFVPDTSLDGISKKLEEWVSTLGKEAWLIT